MFEFISFFALIAVVVGAPGFVAETHVVQPVVAKVSHSVPSAVSHQSFSQVHSMANIATPVIHTYHAAPVVKSLDFYHAAPVVKTNATPVVPTYTAAAPTVNTIAPVVPVVKTVASPVVHSYHAVPVVKTVATPIVHTYAAAPGFKTIQHIAPMATNVKPVIPVDETVSHAVSHHSHAIAHQSHVQVHQRAFVTPIVKTVGAAPVAPVAHAAAVVKSVYMH